MFGSARVLVAVPAFNEEATIEGLVGRVRSSLPDADLLVVDDGSRDRTSETLARLGVRTARHACNLGYGRAIQTALKYAIALDYDTLVTLDADGQHHPEQVRAMLEAFHAGTWDLLVGSRYVAGRSYSGAPLGRRIGMVMFSVLVGMATGRRIYDTTSGLKVIRRSIFLPLVRWHFVDFHAEALAYLMRLGREVGEFPITVAERRHGESMYSLVSAVKYPLKTLLMLVLGLSAASLTARDPAR